MKKTGFILTATLILIVLFYGRTASAQEVDRFGFELINSQNDQFNYRVLLAKDKAIETIVRYIKTPNNSYSRIPEVKESVDNMLKGLNTADFAKRISNSQNSTPCERGVFLFVATVPFFKNIIRICEVAKNFDINQLAQAFIHESYHLFENYVGLAPKVSDPLAVAESEAFATIYEYSIFKGTQGCIFLDSGYYENPGIYKILKQNSTEKPKFCKGYANKQSF